MESETPEEDKNDKIRKSSNKVRRIHHALIDRMPVEVIEHLLQTEGDVNYDIHEECGLQPNLLSANTYYEDPAYFDLLLKYGADFVRKNKEGKTVLHEHIDFHPKNVTLLRLVGNYKNDFVNAILDAHVKYNVTTNPCDENGISHFHVACIANNACVVRFFLENGVDVDQAVNSKSLTFPLDTSMHFAAKYASVESMEILLEYGANVSLKNGDGMTPVHVLVEICEQRLESLDLYVKTLSVLLKFDSSEVNDVDEFGFFKLHAACLLEDECFVESVLEKTENVNQSVNLNSPICPGYTALHFAANSKIEICKLLVKKGADIGAKNGRGKTPIDMLLQKYGAAEVHSILSSTSQLRNILLSDNKTKLTEVVLAMRTSEEFVSFLNPKGSASTSRVPLDSPLSPGYTSLHSALISSMEPRNDSTTNELRVPFDSQLWPGYTLLHLAVIFTEETHFDSTMIAECLRRGSDVTTADVKGSTPVHLAFYLGKRQIVEYLLDNHLRQFINPVDASNLSHFHIACASRHRKAIDHFLSFKVDVNSPVRGTFDWIVEQKSRNNNPPKLVRFFICPGSTALHINVASGDVDITRLLLQHGANVRTKDVNNFTPIHRLLTSTAVTSLTEMTDLLLSRKNLEDRVFKGGLSLLHVACYLGHLEAVEKLLGSGADFNAKVTYRGKGKKLYHDDSVDPYGDHGEPLNFLFAYRDYTPMHFALQHFDGVSTVHLLINSGADFLRKAPDGTCLFDYYLTPESIFQYKNPIFPMLKNSHVLREHFVKKFGWTELHLACCMSDLELVRKSTSEVNAKIRSESPIWKGYTPLHVTADMAFRSEDGRGFAENSKKIVRLLIKRGGDLTLKDDNGDTPLHLHPLNITPFLSFLFECLKNYEVNPTNLQGSSLFHIACATRNLRVVEKYLKRSVDVNQKANYFSAVWSPGGTPMHVVMWNYEYCWQKGFLSKVGFGDDTVVRIVDKLIQHGADVNATDIFGETPLFGVMRLKKYRRTLIQKLISNGADVHVTNTYGTTAFELLLNQKNAVWPQRRSDLHFTWEEIELFLKAGCHLNTFNPVTKVGYIAEICHGHTKTKSQIRSKIDNHPQLTDIDDAGRTAIHNVVSIESAASNEHVLEMIERLIVRGCDINRQDNQGKTALHLAVNMGNSGDIWALLENGADVNLTDHNGKTFIAYVCEDGKKFWPDSRRKVMVILATHIYKLEYCGLPVNKLNKQIYVELLKKYTLENDELASFHVEVEKIKQIDIDDTSLSLYQFLIDTHVDVVYRNMTIEERQKVDRFFQNIDKHKFMHVDCLLKLKYRRVIQRIKLIEPALASFSVLIKYELPELCCRNILRFLNNEDLKNLVALEIKPTN